MSSEAVAVPSPGPDYESILMKAYKFQALDGEIGFSRPNSPCNLHPFTLPTEAIAFFALKTQNNDCNLPT
jgi:hypothetical protein